MKGFLLDTNVISMLSPSRAEASQTFLTWLERTDNEGRLFLSVVSIHELEKGIALLENKGATAKASDLKIWLSGLISTYEDKIISLDASASAIAGQLEAKAITDGYNPGMADAIIAGIAKANDLCVVTYNKKHLSLFDIIVMSPDEAALSI